MIQTALTLKSILKKSKLVFFSVPYDKGWTAYVNGKPADIEKSKLWIHGGKGRRRRKYH